MLPYSIGDMVPYCTAALTVTQAMYLLPAATAFDKPLLVLPAVLARDVMSKRSRDTLLVVVSAAHQFWSLSCPSLCPSP